MACEGCGHGPAANESLHGQRAAFFREGYGTATEWLCLDLYLGGDEGVHMSIQRLAMEEDTIFGPTFESGANGDSHGLARRIAGACHNLQPEQAQLPKTEVA
ncbi:hypothetical protein D3C84_476580 [compost metagenome]